MQAFPIHYLLVVLFQGVTQPASSLAQGLEFRVGFISVWRNYNILHTFFFLCIATFISQMFVFKSLEKNTYLVI